MANASGPATAGALPGEFLHQASGVRFTVSVAGEDAWLAYARPGDPPFGISGRRRLDYYVGSGLRGRTYLSSVDGFWYEAPINWYTPAHAYDMRPGQQNATEVNFDLPVGPFCLSCHTSSAQQPEPGTQNRYPSLPFLHTGITCESCHGDTSQHVASGGTKAVLNPVKLDPERRDSVCEQCHLEAEFVVEKAGKSKAAFVPGAKLSDYVAYFVHASAPKAAIGPVTQVEALAQSGCKRASGSKMNCITCHNPHDRPSENRVQYFRARCLSCHSAPRYATAHHSENADCASCHMPRNTAGDIAHQQVTDHRILRVPQPPGSAAVSTDSHTLTPVLESSANSRDTGLAYAQLARTDPSVIDVALRYLRTARVEFPNDSKVLAELGLMAEAKHLTTEAVASYEDALKADPSNARAGSRLGLIYWRQRNAQKAIALWREVFAHEPRFVGLDLAQAACSVGDRAQTVAVLQRLVQLYPDMTEARLRLSGIQASSNECSTGGAARSR